LTATTALLSRYRTALFIGLLALVLRLILVLILDPSPNFKGGDANWYMFNGHELMTTGKTPGPIQTAPLYPVVLGMVQVLIPGAASGRTLYTHAEMQTVRVLQSILGALLCLFVYTLTRRLLSERAGRLAALVLAISPALILEAGNLTTESLFMFFVFGGLAFYVAAQQDPTPRAFAWAGILFGLATLTRAVFLLFPLGLVVPLFWIHRPRWRRLALALLVSYGLVISTWTIYNALVWQRLVIGGEGFLSFVYQGATSKASPQTLDEQLGISPENANQQRNEAMQKGIKENVLENPLGWIEHRVKELADAYLQPHNTNRLKGKSLRGLASDWVRHDRSLGGLIDLTRVGSFWPKLLLYVFHFGGLLFGAGGLWAGRRQWRSLFSLYAMIFYFTGIHIVLLVLPRYLFPVYPVFWIFGSALLVMAWDWRKRAWAAYHGFPAGL
jgi:4-amino-4-deoxy-L-arabinose transferase-like glycosyltransferase